MTTRLLQALVAGVLLVLGMAQPALADRGELLIKFDVTSEFAPGEVCVHVEKLSSELAEKRRQMLATWMSGAGPELPEGITMPYGTEDCVVASHSTDCSRCKAPPESTYEVCAKDLNTPSTRRVQLLLEHVGLRTLKLEGRNLRLAVDYPDSGSVTPRVEVLGGDYHAGEVDSVANGRDLALNLRPRCITRTLRIPPGSAGACNTDVVTSNGAQTFKGPLTNWERSAAPLQVNENADENVVELDRCGTVFGGAFVYPPPHDIELSPRAFRFIWKPHCLVTDKVEREGCPTATLMSSGHECTSTRCAAGCCYQCLPSSASTFPTPVRFAFKPRPALGPDGAAPDPLTWEETIRFPGDQLAGFVDAEHRRIVLDWREEKRDWDEFGSELDTLEIVAPDGRMQRIEKGTPTLPIAGLQCHDRFTYQYRGRWPNETRQERLRGDTLVLESSLQRQRRLVLGVRAHAGALYYTSISGDGVPTPTFDGSLVGLLDSKLELALSGIFSLHPSLSRFEADEPRREMSWLGRVVLGFGRRFYLNDRFVFVPSLGGGVAFPNLASDWTNVRQYPIAAVNFRGVYEVTRATGLELSAWCLGPEQYLESRQDFTGPTKLESRHSLALGLTAGLQWSDAF